MGTLTIRNLDDAIKQKLRERAAARGVSMEQRARAVLARHLATQRRTRSIFDELTKLGVKPEEPFDQKKITDEMWDESFQ